MGKSPMECIAMSMDFLKANYLSCTAEDCAACPESEGCQGCPNAK